MKRTRRKEAAPRLLRNEFVTLGVLAIQILCIFGTRRRQNFSHVQLAKLTGVGSNNRMAVYKTVRRLVELGLLSNNGRSGTARTVSLNCQIELVDPKILERISLNRHDICDTLND